MTVLGTLQVVFIVLKLNNLIDWSWGWVLFPLWIAIGEAIVEGMIKRSTR